MSEETPAARSEFMSGAAPDFLGAVFETGRSRSYVYDIVTREVLVPIYDVKEPEEREVFILENIRVFRDGTVISPEQRWTGIVDYLTSELITAANKVDLERNDREEAVKDLKAMMAVASTARAMEMSAGDAATYVRRITGTPDGVLPDLDKQDKRADILLHKDPGKLRRVINRRLVRDFYKRIIEDSGIENLEWNEERGEWEGGGREVNLDRALRSELIGYLSSENPYPEDDPRSETWEKKEGFNDYITEILLEDLDDLDFDSEAFDAGHLWAAARLAADAFLVDQFTRWEYEMRDFLDTEDRRIELKPCPEWGGDPLRAIIEPSFLPRRIKKVYPEDELVLNFLNWAFRPDDLLDDVPGRTLSDEVKAAVKGALLEPSMTIHLKTYARFNTALWNILGNSRGQTIPQWTKDTMGKDLPSAVELLDQVYGGAEGPEGMEKKFGKYLMGLITARILHLKAQATALESTRPGFKDRLTLLFGKQNERPFYEVLTFIFGPQVDWRRGFIDSLVGGRTRFIFRDNIFGAEKDFKEIWDLLTTLDQDPKGRGRAAALYSAGFILDAASALQETFGKKH